MSSIFAPVCWRPTSPSMRSNFATGIRPVTSFRSLGNPGKINSYCIGRLLEKMRRALSVKHLKNGDYGLQISDQGIVRGRIEWDKHQDGRPLLVIDGREINWDQFGSMLMSYEGWQFKLTIADKSEEL